MIYTLFVTCPRGLESVLAQELSAIGCTAVQATDGGVSCTGGLAEVYRANLHSRTASRVLLELARGKYRSEQDIYGLAQRCAWTQWFDVQQRFKIHIEGKRSPLKSLNFAALKVKDAVCDVFRAETGARPSVSKEQPDVRIHVFAGEREAVLLLDTSGEALFKRGYRREQGDAPLRENLAAGLLVLAGYNGTQPFQDPFCGSGTIAIEAAWLAQNRAPGLMRGFAFEHLKGFDAGLWQQVRDEARAAVRDVPVAPIAASDHDRAMIAAARSNAAAADVADVIAFSCQDVCDTRPPAEAGILLSNPPYGVRLAEVQALHALYPPLGSWLKQHYAGWTAALLSSDREMTKLMRLSPKRKIPVFNGNLDCRLYLLEMVAGANRRKASENL